MSTAIQAPPTKKGWLLKQSRNSTLFKNWKRRYFVLEAGLLQYFENPLPVNTPPYGENLKGSMSLVQGQVAEQKKQDDVSRRRLFVSAGVGEERDVLIEASNEKEAMEWMESLRQHCRFATAKSKQGSISSPQPSQGIPAPTPRIESPVPPEITPQSESESPSVEQLVETTPWLVMKVLRVDTRAKVFINLSTHPNMLNNLQLRGTSQWPHMVSNPSRQVIDGDKGMVTVYDVVVSPQLVPLAVKDQSVMDEVCDKAIKHLAKYYKENIEDDYKLLKVAKKYKGERVLFSMPPNASCAVGRRASALGIPISTFTPLLMAPTSAQRSVSPVPVPVANLSTNTLPASSKTRALKTSKVAVEESKVEAVVPEQLPPWKERYIPYEVRRVAGTIAKQSLAVDAPRKVLPHGDRVLAYSRRIGEDGLPWLHTNQGWIPERLPGQNADCVPLSGRVAVPTYVGQPHGLTVLKTRFVEIAVDRPSFFESLGQYIFGKSDLGQVSEAAFKTIFMLEVLLPKGAFLKLARSFSDVYVLRRALLSATTDRSLRDIVTRLPFPSLRDGAPELLHDLTALLDFIDLTSKFLEGLLKHAPIDVARGNKLVVQFFAVAVSDVCLIEEDLMVPGGLDGVADVYAEAAERSGNRPDL